ncbi:MAG: alanine--tRNA ligase-related protein [bacterium]|nr:alanine--tRNA ligase-related protein [bacterium]
MSSEEIRNKFLEFFKERGHAIVPSSSLIPDDPSVLLTTAGMQQFKKYFTGELDFTKDYPRKIGAASCQKSFRTSDIDEVGDETHNTFFEMLGNFSFGGYFKKEAITYAYDFITKEMGLEISYVTIFEGKDDIGVPKDIESRDIWKSLDPNLKIIEQGMEDVFWGPTGSSGPCGPTTEIYCKNNAMNKPVEIWNIVFNQYLYPGSREELNAGASGKKLEPLKTPGVDTGMGLERLAMCMQKTKTIFETDLFREALKFNSQGKSGRVFSDHIRASAFLIADGVLPSNKGAGYILRRLMRRAIVQSQKLAYEDEGGGSHVTVSQISEALKNIANFYGNAFNDYKNLLVNENVIHQVFNDELEKFMKTLNSGFRELHRLHSPEKIGGKLSAKDAFNIYQSYGFPREVMKDFCEERGIQFDDNGFEEEFKAHQEISRAGQEKKFGGHGLILNTGELKAANEEELKKVTRLHTATHMLQQALREVLGPEVKQAGSDITVERTRFDFAFSRKLTPEEIKAVEEKVNEKIKEDLPMQKVILPKAEAEKTGALFFFKEKYPDPVNVYFIGKDLKTAWSKEFCGGPHVTHTGEIGTFKIIKEEAVGSGVRRIRGTVEP